jgi:hypothetical protein
MQALVALVVAGRADALPRCLSALRRLLSSPSAEAAVCALADQLCGTDSTATTATDTSDISSSGGGGGGGGGNASSGSGGGGRDGSASAAALVAQLMAVVRVAASVKLSSEQGEEARLQLLAYANFVGALGAISAR